METGVGNKRILPNTGVPDELYEEVDSETLQFYVKGSFEYYAMLWSRLGLMTSLNVGELSNKRLLRNDLYRLGGLRSIRGFNENFFFTNRYVYTNFEPRYYFGGDSYFLVFLDMGRLENSLMEKSGGIDYPLSFGAGISLETQSGVFNFIYGVGKSNHQEMGVNFSKIHFGYTGRF